MEARTSARSAMPASQRTCFRTGYATARRAVGLRADLNVIDLAKLRLFTPHLVRDLPAGGHRLLQSASGYRATLVAGHTILQDDQLTDALPGRLVRLGRA
jgi:N-acyl-D-aspartate/D-glutamate deacylase